MEETTSAFLMDLRYRFCSRKRDPLQGSRGVTNTLSPVLVIHVIWPVIHVTWLPSCRAWFSARSLGRGPGYVRTHLKHKQCLQPISFKNMRPQLMCSRHNMGCINYIWQLVFAIINNNWLTWYVMFDVC